MRKSFLSMAALLVMLLTNSCHKEDTGKNNGDGEQIHVTANISQSEVTKVDINPTDGMLTSVVWTPKDNVAVFGKNGAITQGYLGKLENEATEPSKKARFSGDITSSVDEMYYVLYPNSSDYILNTTTGTALPLNLANQTGTTSGFTYLSNSMFMRAVGQKAAGAEIIDFSMAHLCALLQFNIKLKEYKEGIKLKSIQVSGGSIINKKSYNIYDNLLTDAADAGNSMVLSFANDEPVFSSDSLTVAMPAFPTEATGDVNISVIFDNNGAEQTLAFDGTMPLLEATKRYNKTLEIDLPEPEMVTVYVAGYENNGSNNVAKVWKNGLLEHALTDGTKAAQAQSVYVSGSDVYVAGYEQNSLYNNVAKVWKNGQEIFTTDGTQDTEVQSIYVLGNDVYIAGTELNSSYINIAKVWKNGQEIFTSNGTQSELAWSVYVSDNDVYVAGDEVGINSIMKAKVWKNGQAIFTTDGTQHAHAQSIYVSGSDVYVAGNELNPSNKSVAKVWKNGQAIFTTDGTQYAQAQSVYVSGSDVYVAGYEENGSNKSVAKVWKNGQEIFTTDGTQFAGAYDIYVLDNDVYIAGNEFNSSNKSVAKVWKNGQEIFTTDGTQFAEAKSIFVKK